MTTRPSYNTKAVVCFQNVIIGFYIVIVLKPKDVIKTFGKIFILFLITVYKIVKFANKMTLTEKIQYAKQ